MSLKKKRLKQEELKNMKFREKWNLEYDKDNMRNVLIGGGIATIITSALGVLIDYVLWEAESNFFIGIFVISLIIAAVINIVRKEYHVRFSVIAVLYSAIGFLILHGVRYFLIFKATVAGFFEYLFLYPFYRLYQGIIHGQAIGILYGLLTVIAYIAALVAAYFLVKVKGENEKEKK